MYSLYKLRLGYVYNESSLKLNQKRAPKKVKHTICFCKIKHKFSFYDSLKWKQIITYQKKTIPWINTSDRQLCSTD